MENPVFQPKSFESAIHLVVGECNGIKGLVRWEQETPLFVDAISRFIDEATTKILDYGCGIGRLAKGILAAHDSVEVFGVDDSPKQLDAALAYVNSERFETLLPAEMQQQVDLVYCIYVLQHIPAIEIREALQRIHYHLKPGGKFIYCSSDCRMAVRFDQPAFFDDRFLGVNLRREIERFFQDPQPLFEEEMIAQHEILQRMILGTSSEDNSKKYLAHPALVYTRREIEGPLFNAPFPK